MAPEAATQGEQTTAPILELNEGTDLASPQVRAEVREALENGSVIFLPHRGFTLTARERQIITDPDIMFGGKEDRCRDSGRPTLTYDPASHRLLFNSVRRREKPEIRAMLRRYAAWSADLLETLVPDFAAAGEQSRVIYRPVDRRSVQGLHVDVSYANPTQGRSKLRIFCNVDPKSRPRVWQVGEPFEHLVHRYLPQVRGTRNWAETAGERLGRLAGIVKGRPTPYDHLLADIRDGAKRDKTYQKTAPRRIVEFPEGSTWIALTDVVLHGGVSGQHSLDQVFFIPSEAFKDPSRSALSILERLSGRRLA